MQLEIVQYTAKAHTTCAFGLLPRFLVVLFAATVSLVPTATVLAQQSAQTAGQTQGAVDALAATTTKTQKETALNQLNTVQPDTATDTAAFAIRPIRVNVPQAAMHAALDINIPNYASAIVTTNEVVDSISGSRSERF